MTCIGCGTGNRVGTSFCKQCGQALRRRAPRWTSVVPQGAQVTAASALVALGLLGLAFVAGSVIPRVQALVFERGWMQFAIVGLAAWCGGLLVAKARDLQRERAAIEPALLPDRPLGPEEVDAFLMERPILAGTAVAGVGREALFATRLRLAFDQFKASGSSARVSNVLRQQAETDLASMEGSYATLRLLLWAIPVLGFIGTVIAIGSAVSGFAGLLANADGLEQLSGSMREALGVVSSGLGVAFDATLLALLLSLPVMALTSVSQQREEALHVEVAALLTRALLPMLRGRDLPSGEAERAGTTLTARYVEAFVGATRMLAEAAARLERQVQATGALAEGLREGLERAEEERTSLRTLGNGHFLEALSGLRASVEDLRPTMDRLTQLKISFGPERERR